MLYNSDIFKSFKNIQLLNSLVYYFICSYKTLTYVPGSELGSQDTMVSKRDSLCAMDPSQLEKGETPAWN